MVVINAHLSGRVRDVICGMLRKDKQLSEIAILSRICRDKKIYRMARDHAHGISQRKI